MSLLTLEIKDELNEFRYYYESKHIRINVGQEEYRFYSLKEFEDFVNSMQHFYVNIFEVFKELKYVVEDEPLARRIVAGEKNVA